MTDMRWVPGRWYRVLQADGSLWMETSDRMEAMRDAKSFGFKIVRQWVFEGYEWREELE